MTRSTIRPATEEWNNVNISNTCREPCISRLFLLLASWLWCAAASSVELGLQNAVQQAQSLDPWIEGNRQQQRAIAAQSIAAGSLPDPMLSTGFGNLPTDTFDFNQEPMTQFSVGISQTLPRGDSRSLRQQRLRLLEQQHPYQRADRRARVEAEVTGLWLEAWRAAESIRLIEEDSDLFRQLVDVAESSYVNSIQGTLQQDLVFAQSELTRLEDRLVVLQEQRDTALARLEQWLQGGTGSANTPAAYDLPQALPEITPRGAEIILADQLPEQQRLAELLAQHPALQTVERRLEASSTAIKLAQQEYQPEWTLNASYGYRDDDPLGRPRADFFSVGVSFDLPLFTSKRQDQEVISATASAESMRTDKALLLRRMIAEMRALHARLRRLDERHTLYQERLLDDMRAQVESSLEAYTNDDGEFSEVIRAKITELNTRIAAIDIEVARQKTLADLNYFFASTLDAQDN